MVRAAVFGLFGLSACGLALEGTGPGASGTDAVDDGGVPSNGRGGDATTTADANRAPDGGSSPDGGSLPDARPSSPDGSTDARPEVGPTYPATCAELGSAAVGHDVTLFLDKDASKPFDAHCETNGKTYLLLNADDEKNYSSYPRGGCASGISGQTQAVKTTWKMVLFDPATRMVDTGDYAGATSTGGTHEDSGSGTVHNDYFRMPFASGRSCLGGQSLSPVAQIDLEKTNFAVAGTQAWNFDGYQPAGGVPFDAKNQSATISTQGSPVGASPCRLASDYYTLTGGNCLQLEYIGP